MRRKSCVADASVGATESVCVVTRSLPCVLRPVWAEVPFVDGFISRKDLPHPPQPLPMVRRPTHFRGYRIALFTRTVRGDRLRPTRFPTSTVESSQKQRRRTSAIPFDAGSSTDSVRLLPPLSTEVFQESPRRESRSRREVDER